MVHGLTRAAGWNPGTIRRWITPLFVAFLCGLLAPQVAEAGTYEPTLWPGGVIPYEFDAGVDATQQAAAIAAMNLWEEAVGWVDFRPRSGDPNYIYFLDSFQNAAPVGFHTGKNTVHLYNWNHPGNPSANSHIIVHELGHVLGLYHEHRRADRAPYIQVLWSQIEPGRDSDFYVVPAPADAYGPYDFDSLMHGPQCHETHCAYCPLFDPVALDTCRTLRVLPPYDTDWQSEIGNRDHLSTWDARVVSFLYASSPWIFVDQSYTGTEAGTFLAPYRLFTTGEAAVPTGGVLWVSPGVYSSIGSYSTPMRIEAPMGNVRLQ